MNHPQAWCLHRCGYRWEPFQFCVNALGRSFIGYVAGAVMEARMTRFGSCVWTQNYEFVLRTLRVIRDRLFQGEHIKKGFETELKD